MKYSKIFDYVPQLNRGWLQGSCRCFGTGLDVMGIIGILLLLGGVVQIGAGTYFMIILPIFDSASNIWTGIITGFVGAIYMHYGCINQTGKKQYVNLSLSLVALITNVTNLVIIVVGERGVFLSEEDKLQIDRESKNNLYKIAIWGTASTSCTILLILFIVAQMIFCGYLQTGGSKAKSNTVTHFQNQKQERFFPPSRVINSKNSSYLIPTLDDMVYPHTSPNSAWVYNGEDKLHAGFYPMGFESHPNSLESGRRPAARHSSFAEPQRYAQVLHRPQRAQSFASNRDPFSLHGTSYSKGPNLQLPIVPRVKRCQMNPVRRSVSMNSYQGVTATLSKKYQDISHRQGEAAVIEVGSIISDISEHSLADALIDRQPIISGRTEKMRRQNETISDRNTNKGTYTKYNSHKGPAPQPPKFKQSIPKVGTSEKSIKPHFNTKEYVPDAINFDQMSEEVCNCKSEEEEICIEQLEKRFEIDKNQIHESYHKADNLSKKVTARVSKSAKNRSDIPMEDQNATEKEIENHKEFSIALKSYLASSKFSNKGSWEKLEQVLMEILSQNTEQKNKIVNKSYKQDNTIEQLQVIDTLTEDNKSTEEQPEPIVPPPQDVQKNKIVLRVPSFKNSSCQTEYYRPVRKKQSFTQPQLPKVSPITPLWNNDVDVQVNTSSSSSSGYSSPEAESKGSTPINSGPPSPSATGSGEGPNVTIIEINRSDFVSRDIFNRQLNSVSPPKPYRLKSISNNIPNVHNNYGQTPHSPVEKTKYTNSTQTNEPTRGSNLVTEAVNPDLVQRTEPTNYAPRIVDVVHKNRENERISRHDTFTGVGRQRIANVRTNSLSLPRVSYANQKRPRLHRSESRSPSPPKQIAKLGPHPALDKPESTAAYLASLELLASHYRQQALANAKQLQMQRTMLEQRRKFEAKKKTPDIDPAWLPQTINHA